MKINHRIINYIKKESKTSQQDISEIFRNNSSFSYQMDENFDVIKQINKEINNVFANEKEKTIFHEYFFKSNKIRNIAKLTNLKTSEIKKIIDNLIEKIKNNNKIKSYYYEIKLR